ncbi:hypothetical protein F4X73_13665 [Candidatus Poribacteria bacterium]|nr:hypothetical protein [Candidatus Poribacteria bacterium]
MKQNYLSLKASFLLYTINLCILISLTSCNNNLSPPDPPDPISEHSPGDISENLVARIYFDASASMRGFVVPSSTRYKGILRPLESVITSGWKNGKAEFFKFGEQVNPIDRDSYLMAGSADFYDEMRTYIQKIFEYEDQLIAENRETDNTPEDSSEDTEPSTAINDSIKENRLVVIVTDLFQDRQDVNLLVSQLKEKYIQNGIEIGLLGLRSEFDGKVYNLGTAPILYRSTPGDPETFRPFYLLVIGKHADISEYFDRIKANGFPDAETIIFSRHLVNPLSSFKDAKIEPENLNSAYFVPDDPRLLQYEIVQNSQPAKISAKGLKYNRLPHAIDFDVDKIDPSKVIAELKQNSTAENEISPDAQECLEVIPARSENENGHEFTIDFILNSESLPSNAVYLYKVTLSPKRNSYQTPDWCLDWDMGTESNGAKTLNLVNFVRGLMDTTVNQHKPEIAHFYFYIKKR